MAAKETANKSLTLPRKVMLTTQQQEISCPVESKDTRPELQGEEVGTVTSDHSGQVAAGRAPGSNGLPQ